MIVFNTAVNSCGKVNFVNIQKIRNMQIYFLFIIFTQNNIFLTLTNYKGEIFFWNSIGTLKVKGLKKLTNSTIKNFIFNNLINIKLTSSFHVKFKGFNKSKKIFIKTILNLLAQRILSISDDSMNATNGCKLKKKRRL
uniref:ribosomal protein S11 n=1 Tax=Polysiphonia morrowii TaxID=173542 RepID=UPI002E79EF34|nr:ribosomal protein S11 [Polysiphonia morrowii]WQF69608.1 ribosomal protein S11 [Polysiphonia morrowii]